MVVLVHLYIQGGGFPRTSENYHSKYSYTYVHTIMGLRIYGYGLKCSCIYITVSQVKHVMIISITWVQFRHPEMIVCCTGDFNADFTYTAHNMCLYLVWTIQDTVNYYDSILTKSDSVSDTKYNSEYTLHLHHWWCFYRQQEKLCTPILKIYSRIHHIHIVHICLKMTSQCISYVP